MPHHPHALRRRPLATVTPLALALLIATLAAPVALARGAAPGSSKTFNSVPPPPNATGILEGIDVSHWQGTITWSKVAAAGKKFAIIKASEDVDYVDPTFATNRAGAQAAGMWTGAYHFARPDATANDAINEANHFVATVKLGAGDLIPALDLEDSGGLSVTGLQAWVTAWLNQVTARIGIRPMIYTSPAFWTKYMGDSHALADAGYKTLWVAHWGVSAPTVPASNWGGRGWTFWQYSNAGSVPGISGRVDLDRYHGTDLMPQAYSVFRLTASAGGQVKQGQVGSVSVAISRTNFPTGITFHVDGLPDGATAADSDPITGSSTSLKIATDSGSTHTGTYPLTITGTGAGQTKVVKVSLVVIDGIPPTVSAPWTKVAVGHQLGTTIPAVIGFGATDPSGISSMGLQRTLAGGAWSTVKLPSGTAPMVVEALPLSSTVQHRGRASDRLGNLSAWVTAPAVRTAVYQQTSTTVKWTGSWGTRAQSSASGGSVRAATAKGATATFTFTGTSVGWVATKGPGRGNAYVYLDGVYAGMVNLLSSTYHTRTIVFVRNFATPTTHTLKIVVAGTTHHPYVDVDAFVRFA